MDKLSPDLIATGLSTRWMAQHIVFFETVGSTNDEARRLALQGTPEGTLVIANEQTAGRGRLQRRWVAPLGQALLFTLIFYPSPGLQDAYQLTMLGSLACVHAIEEQTGLQPEIKWPNDLLLNGKKLSGILSEICWLDDGSYVIVGIGINVNVDFSPWPELREQATSLREVLGRPVARLPLLQSIIRQFEAGYDQLLAGGSPHADWAARLGTLGKHVRVVTHEGTYEGVARNVGPDGALILELADGRTTRLLVGDVERLR